MTLLPSRPGSKAAVKYRPTLTREAAWAIATDRANTRARDGGRMAWNRGDYNYAVHVFNRLWPGENDK